MKRRQSNFFVLTGAPGVGKTTLVKELRAHGIICVDEPAREILAEQKAVGGDGIPEKNPSRFIDLLISRSIQNFENYQNLQNLVVFDRGIIDSIGYASLFEIETEPFEKVAQNYVYNRNVFVLAPWKEIYATDDERKMAFEDTIQFHEQILNEYVQLDYSLIEVPFGTIKERAKFLMDQVKALGGYP